MIACQPLMTGFRRRVCGRDVDNIESYPTPGAGRQLPGHAATLPPSEEMTRERTVEVIMTGVCIRVQWTGFEARLHVYSFH